MAVTAYDIVIATDATSLKSEVLAATGQVPQGEPFVRGGFPGQALVTGTPIVGYASAAYNVIIGFDTADLKSKVNAAISATQQPIGGPVVRGDALIQVLATITEAGGGGDVTVTSAQITDATTVGKSVLTAANAAAARTAIGAGTSSLTVGTTGTTAMAGDKFVQGAIVANPTATTSAAWTASTAADVDGVVTDLNTLGTNYNNLRATNESILTQFNALLTQLRDGNFIAEA